ncbi:MAG: ribosomal-processing cysteine protease Prp [Clostridia bacterium]|nr:ribosomal-processing cysteine protease Prp [Clostridia bacterium]MBR6787481.1 ribosomal-processing cysteine protease Prp [Clostridia bacterium]
MTTVTLLHSEGKLSGFLCKGHAGFARAGKDIVCAAVSVLSTTCANALESVAGIVPEIEVDDGYMKVMLPDGCDNHDAMVILRTFEQGVRDIEASYPKYIHITTR